MGIAQGFALAIGIAICISLGRKAWVASDIVRRLKLAIVMSMFFYYTINFAVSPGPRELRDIRSIDRALSQSALAIKSMIERSGTR